MARDVIFSAFATPSQSNLNAAGMRDWTPRMVQPLDEFDESPLLVNVPKTGAPGQQPEAWGGKGFVRTADQARAAGDGSIIQGMLRKYAAGVKPRRIALIGFSAGNSFLARTLQSSVDRDLLDTVISLDGMTYNKSGGKPIMTGNISGWIEFGKKATGTSRMAAGETSPYLTPLFVIAHTRIEPSPANAAVVSSTHKASDLLIHTLEHQYNTLRDQLPASVVQAQGRRQLEVIARLQAALEAVPQPVTINCGGASQTYEWKGTGNAQRGKGGLWPWLGYLGNLWNLNFEGVRGPDHCMIAYVAQQAIFRTYLIPRWNSRSDAVAGLGEHPDGIGGDLAPGSAVVEGAVAWTKPDAARPGGAIILPGALSTGTSLAPVAIGAVGLAAAGATYLALRNR